MPLRRRHTESEGIAPRRPHAGLLRRERRTLLNAREQAVADVGGLAVEMYRRGGFRDDLLAERCSIVVGIDARLAEIEELLHVRRNVPRCQCGAPILRGSRFCPNCGRPHEVGSDAQSDPAELTSANSVANTTVQEREEGQ